MQRLGDLPQRPKQAGGGAQAEYYSLLARIKTEIINSTMSPIEYHIAKTARGDYDALRNQIEIGELWKITLVRLMEEV